MNYWIGVGSFTMFLGVALGAFGAHGLKQILGSEMKVVYQTAVFYQLVHGLAIFMVAILGFLKPHPLVSISGWCFLVGILLFSGSLYSLSLSGISRLGMVTPFGGLAFLIGWALLFFSAVR
jgi:uncharacterized membrane protein YgdD (TMEM256/DUF423 family)